ncbi:Bacteriorhodopsin [Natronorubrum sediminis]|uniref:Bacteriorhodopsin n=1 Tax=Natronorubrum sediminis TaxID=640943 RepID=A0A1H6G2Z8_9EURY|nr:bacteriorhodopsin [Natronorubrum sediminis]SEH17471.1 Bacteriorhodopsin [Natronorubrum sediminis]
MIPELEMYRIGAAITALATVAFLVWVARKPAGLRRYYLPVPIICGTLSLAYLGMSLELLRFTTPDGEPVALTRYVEYYVATPIMVVLAGMIAGASRRQLVTLVVLVFAWISVTIVGVFQTPPEALVLNGLTVVVLGVLIYTLVWPITARSGQTSGERVLLFGKLRNLLLLLWVGYLVIGVISRQGIGLLDAFGGIFVGAYLDIATRIGFGILVLRATDAMVDLRDARTGGDSDGTDVTFSDSSATDTEIGSGSDPDIEPAD